MWLMMIIGFVIGYLFGIGTAACLMAFRDNS